MGITGKLKKSFEKNLQFELNLAQVVLSLFLTIFF